MYLIYICLYEKFEKINAVKEVRRRLLLKNDRVLNLKINANLPPNNNISLVF